MSNDVAIALKSISKLYKRYNHPSDRFKEILLPGKVRSENFWALRDISLQIKKGETVGIIGRNGSGKSTLLQIIAGTLQPTTGEVQVNGRISALLELGSGFNPEFTGRQNVFFNARILGLSKEETEDKFDKIAAFADIGEFINQPVKTYSSGMFIRLAFAVASSIDPDIFIVDEALSVGDEAFQRKCFARIYAIQESGASILFVSHAANSIIELCSKALLIDQGDLLITGLPKTVITQYQKLIYAPNDKKSSLREQLKNGSFITKNKQTDPLGINIAPSSSGQAEAACKDKSNPKYDPSLQPQDIVSYQSRGAKIENIKILNFSGEQVNLLIRNQRFLYTYSVKFSQDCFKVRFGMLCKTISGLELGGAASHPMGHEIPHIPAGITTHIKFEFTCLLLPGTYFLNAGLLGRIGDEDVYLDRRVDAVMFKVLPEPKLCQTGTVDFQVKSSVSTHAHAKP